MRLKTLIQALAIGLPTAYAMNKIVDESFVVVTNIHLDQSVSNLTAITWAIAACLMAYRYVQSLNLKKVGSQQ